MKKSFILLLSLICLNVSAQKAAKIYQKVQKSIDQKLYDEAIDYLDRLPKEEKTTAEYYKLISHTFDLARQYPKAIKYYKLYLSVASDSIAQQRLTILKTDEDKRIAAWNAKLERIKDCPKCHGTDSIETEIPCQKCQGSKHIRKRCNRCNGKGEIYCGACNGTGSVTNTAAGTTYTCTKCGGTGGTYCTMQCDHGYLIEDCAHCSGAGYETILVKCDKHE